MRKKEELFLLIGFIFFILLLINFLHNNDRTPFASQGIVNLGETSYVDDNMIALDGEWEFYEGKLLDPDSFLNGVTYNRRLIHVPGAWNTEEEKKGIGTYRLIIKNAPIGEVFSIKKQNIRSASKIFINGKLLSEEGNVADNRDDYIARNTPKIISFHSDTDQIEVIIQVSDFSFYSAGIAHSIFFGKQDVITNKSIKKVLYELAIITFLLTIGVLYILLYLFVERYRRKEFFILSFALSCIFFAIINLCMSERTILYFIPNLSYEMMFKIKDTSIFLANISFIIIVTQINQRLLARWLKYSLILGYSFYILIIFTSPILYHSLLPFFISLNCISYIYILIKTTYFYLKNNTWEIEQHHINMFNILNINLYSLNLVLYSFGITTKLQLGFLNILLYAIGLAIYLARMVNQSYKRNEYLSHELDMTEQAYLVAQIKPHFFFNTLTSVMALCYTDGKKAAQLLGHFSNFLRQSFKFNTQESYVTVEQELKLVNSYIAIQKERLGDNLHIESNIDPEAFAESIIPLSIQPLVENAISHGIHPKEQGGQVKISIRKEQSSLVISVFDTGVGIPNDRILELLDIANKEKSGIGIVNVNKRLAKYHQTQLNIDSKEGFWTRVSFKVPLH